MSNAVRTRRAVVYIVRGTWRFPTSHRELFIQCQVGAWPRGDAPQLRWTRAC